MVYVQGLVINGVINGAHGCVCSSVYRLPDRASPTAFGVLPTVFSDLGSVAGSGGMLPSVVGPSFCRLLIHNVEHLFGPFVLGRRLAHLAT